MRKSGVFLQGICRETRAATDNLRKSGVFLQGICRETRAATRPKFIPSVSACTLFLFCQSCSGWTKTFQIVCNLFLFSGVSSSGLFRLVSVQELNQKMSRIAQFPFNKGVVNRGMVDFPKGYIHVTRLNREIYGLVDPRE